MWLNAKPKGCATFDDLLVWARDLLRDDAPTRRHFQERYAHILIDEFQDTDPLQAEIAFYLAAAPDAEHCRTELAHHPPHPGQAVHRGRLQAVHIPVSPGRHRRHPVGEGEPASCAR